jgi:hypothetical protein
MVIIIVGDYEGIKNNGKNDTKIDFILHRGFFLGKNQKQKTKLSMMSYVAVLKASDPVMGEREVFKDDCLPVVIPVDPTPSICIRF